MKIIGNGKVSAIRLTHKGSNLNFEKIIPEMYMESFQIDTSIIAFLEFDDTLEIDAMIAMLNRFKDECIHKGFGRWREEHETD